MKPAIFALAALTVGLAVNGCIGSTGGDLFEFDAYAAGPADATSGALAFDTSRGYHVTLTRARLHIGAVYLNRSVPVSVSSDTTCTLPGIYVAEVPAAVDVDLLSAEPTPFPVRGDATVERARTGEVWLMGGDVDAEADSTPILEVEGTAENDAGTIPFRGTLTIGQNRVVPPAEPSLPGANPICKQRIVSPIPLDLDVRKGGHLLLRVDPRGFFANVDFVALPAGGTPGATRTFADTGADQASVNLYAGLRSASRSYDFQWVNE